MRGGFSSSDLQSGTEREASSDLAVMCERHLEKYAADSCRDQRASAQELCALIIGVLREGEVEDGQQGGDIQSGLFDLLGYDALDLIEWVINNSQNIARRSRTSVDQEGKTRGSLDPTSNSVTTLSPPASLTSAGMPASGGMPLSAGQWLQCTHAAQERSNSTWCARGCGMRREGRKEGAERGRDSGGVGGGGGGVVWVVDRKRMTREAIIEPGKLALLVQKYFALPAQKYKYY